MEGGEGVVGLGRWRGGVGVMWVEEYVVVIGVSPLLAFLDFFQRSREKKEKKEM